MLTLSEFGCSVKHFMALNCHQNPCCKSSASPSPLSFLLNELHNSALVIWRMTYMYLMTVHRFQTSGKQIRRVEFFNFSFFSFKHIHHSLPQKYLGLSRGLTIIHLSGLQTCRTLFKTPKQSCMRNLERFWQSSILRKIPNALFPPNPSIVQIRWPMLQIID